MELRKAGMDVPGLGHLGTGDGFGRNAGPLQRAGVMFMTVGEV